MCLVTTVFVEDGEMHMHGHNVPYYLGRLDYMFTSRNQRRLRRWKPNQRFRKDKPIEEYITLYAQAGWNVRAQKRLKFRV